MTNLEVSADQNDLTTRAEEIIGRYRSSQAVLIPESRSPGDDADEMTGFLADLPHHDPALAAEVMRSLAFSDLEQEQLTAALIIDRLARVDYDAARPIWMQLLRAESPVREDALETLMGRAAHENSIDFSQAAPLILYYLGRDPVPYRDDSGKWHDQYPTEDHA